MARRRFHRVRHHAANAMRGGKTTAIQALVGAVTAFAIGKTAEHVQFIRDNWYGPPALLVGVGHFVKRKHPAVGSAIVATGGAVGYYGYALSHAANAPQATGETGDADAFPVDPGDAGEMAQGNAGQFDAYAGMGARGLTGSTAGQVSPNAGDDSGQYSEAYGIQG